MNHRTAPVELLERVAVPPGGLVKALHALRVQEHLAEIVLLSTCNRTEVYARTTLFHPAVQDVRDFLAAHASLDADELGEHLYTYHDDAAVAHLFGVAAGVDSMIIGEGEILGQVREAWRAAEHEGTAGQVLSRIFRQALEVGKRSRTETEIGRHAVSVSSAAVALAAQRLGSLERRRVLVLGAGDVGEAMAITLAGAGADEIVVANRTASRAHELARRVGGRAIALGEIADELVRADVLLTSTGATDIVIERSDVESVMERRGGRALLIVDVAMPRDVDPDVKYVFGVMLLDMDDLKAFALHSLEQRQREVGRVRTILADELERFRAERSAREVAPVVTALRGRAEEIRLAELERFRARLAALDPVTRKTVDALTTGIVNKLLHDPTVRVKDAAGTPRGELFTDAITELFSLDELRNGPDNQ
jgi:glutamyl-tRNA reductase